MKSYKIQALILVISAAIALTWPAPTSAAPLAQSGRIHVVAPGEYLSTIAAKYGVSSYDIQTANGISNPNHIWVGQRLTIPECGSASNAPGYSPNSTTPPTGSSGSSSGAAATPVPQGRTGCTRPYYIVQFGDYPSGIAQRCGISLDELGRANGYGIWRYIIPGQRLYIPPPGGGTAVPVPSSTQAATTNPAPIATAAATAVATPMHGPTYSYPTSTPTSISIWPTSRP